MGVAISFEDWQTHGQDIPLLVNCQPAGEYLGESYHRAGGVPAVIGELIRAGRIDNDALTVAGKTMGELNRATVAADRDVIRAYHAPLLDAAGSVVIGGTIDHPQTL